MKPIRKSKRVLRTLFWSTPMWARDGLTTDSSIAAEILVTKSWRYSAMFAFQLIAALAMQWQCYERIKTSVQRELFLTSIILFIFIGVAPLVGYLVRHARLSIRLAKSPTGLSTSQLENAALIYLSPILIWLAGLLPLSYAINRAVRLHG
jgi:hypothetical protein